jgi:cell division protein ZapA
MSNENEDAMNITVMGREFYVSCPHDEREELLQAAVYLDKKIQEIKAEGKVVSSERILIIAALSLSHEAQIMRKSNGFDISEFKRRITGMRNKLDEVLIKKD